MKKPFFLFAAIGIPLASGMLAHSQASDLKAAYEKNNDVFIIQSNGNTSQVTHDAIPKDHLVWSKDGTHLAFLQLIDKERALGELIVVDAGSGTRTADILVRPVTLGEVDDMRFIESVEWLTSTRIAVAGSINPSTEETLVMDLNTGNEIFNYYDDFAGTAFSPNGQHAAYVSGAPHFGPLDQREPALNIDLSRVYPEPGVRVDFLAGPTWAPDRNILAALSEVPGSQKMNLVVCPVEGPCRQVSLSQVAGEKNFVLEWTGDLIGIRSNIGRSWSIESSTLQVSGGSMPTSNHPLGSPSLAQQATNSVAILKSRIEGDHGRSADFWCDRCAIAQLPRKTVSW